MKHPISALSLCAALGLAGPASADIITDLANATIIEDFQFGDDIGTSYNAAINSANPGNLLSTDSDLSGVVTDGAGRLNASVKSNTDFGSTLVDTLDRSTGRVFGVMEVTWDFQSTLDPAENEELRISLISGGTSTVMAEFEIQREDDNTVTILGNSVNGTDIDSATLNGGSVTQIEKFVAVVEADLDADTFQVHYSSDGGSTFTTLGSGTTDPLRNLDKMRIVLNNDLSGDNVLIDRAYLAVIPEPASAALMALGGLAMLRRRR